MTAAIPSALNTQQSKAAPWWEIILVMAVSLGISLAAPELKLAGILIPVAYLIIEGRLRRRTWADIGFDPRGVPAGLRQNLGWILLVGVGIQALAAFGSYFLLPEYASHIIARLPVELTTLNAGLIVALGVSTLGEEIVYRALFQGRMAAFLPPAAAIGISSLVFALMHFSPGPALIVVIDLLLVFVDSVIFGIIFHRSRNVLVSWIAHFLADVVGLVFLLMIR